MGNIERLKFLLIRCYIAYNKKKMLLILSSSKKDGRVILAISQQYIISY